MTQDRIVSIQGTHIDAPNHFIDQGITIEKIPLPQLIGEALVVEVADEVNVISAEVLSSHSQIGDILRARKILFRTRNSTFWQKYPAQFMTDYVGIDTSGADFLSTLNPDLIGVDYLSIAPP